MKISVCIIAKNEEDILALALESVKDADEIIFVDTGSTDKTIEIAKQYTDKIYNFPWIDDFSAARNFAIEQATGDWIYSIDCDHKLLSTIEEVRAEAIQADSLGQKTASVMTLTGKDKKPSHWREVLFKNDPEVRWHGAVHEVLLPASTYRSKVVRWCGYSKNHYSDPDRNIRILEKNEITKRSKFYLGREHYERRRYEQAIEWMSEYLKEGKWAPEIAEAWLTIARCHWFLQRGDMAREACLQAIRTNPDFKEALSFMGSMHYEPYKHKWLRLAEAATNEDVLFKR